MTAERRVLGMKPETLFQVFKYTIYTLIFGNLVYFVREEYIAATVRFPDGVGFGMLIDAFSQSTDSFAWLVLLLTFELETYIIPDEKLKGPVKWTLNLIAGVCYVLITQALLGYISHMNEVMNFIPYAEGTACAAVGSVSSLALDLYEFADLTAQNCGSIDSSSLFYHEGYNALTDGNNLYFLEELAVLDVVNASTWLLIVLVLWIDIFLQLRGELTEKLYKWNGALKAVLYLTLIACCVYWGWLGDLVGFLDSLWWILAFFFIEMNLFKWHESTPAEDDLVTESGDAA
ncbi:hypothetical protein [Kordiimonas lacus]|uniref:Uncharacterized protein n=1 Tax=Kordiimonas lacus TaxID=637679 RepID=A0A1G6VVI5_9PROT|nr:hypothetical protein [Kordiimonas lacus]SDD56997.1 hypothetical protein SAMN04488071_0853 [Kordiimonas lacus]